MSARIRSIGGVLLAIPLAVSPAGCGGKGPGAGAPAEAAGGPRPIPVTVAPLERRNVERTVDVIGSLRGWEQVTLGSKRTGRVIKVYHDMGDRIKPGDPIVELDPVDAKLAVDEAESKYLGALVKLGISRKQAEDFAQTYGITEDLLHNPFAEEAISRAPSVVEKRVARDKAHQNLVRQRNLTQRGAGTAQEQEDAENEYRSAVASYENAVYAARNIIAEAFSARVELQKSQQTLLDMTVRAPEPRHLPPSPSTAAPVTYGLTRRQVAEGQFIKEGETVAELVIEDPVRLWTQVPEHHADVVHVGQRVRVSARSHPDMTFEGRVSRISPSVDSTSRTFQVETLIPNKRGLLRPGGLARAFIVVDEEDRAAIVPTEAVVHYAGVTKIFLVDHDKAKAIDDIKIGLEGRGWVEVVSSRLPQSADVVTTGQTQLADGTAVVVRHP